MKVTCPQTGMICENSGCSYSYCMHEAMRGAYYLSNVVKGVEKERDQWKERCLAAEEVAQQASIWTVIGAPHLASNYYEALDKWRELKKQMDER